MASSNWQLAKTFVASYLVVAVLAAVAGSPIPAYRVGLFAAVICTGVVAAVDAGRSLRDRLDERAADS